MSELNFLDTTINGAYDNGSSVILVNGMVQGTTASTRLGRKISVKSVQLRHTVTAGTAGGTGNAKWALVYDRQTNGVAPTWQDVYDNSTALGSNSTQAMRNMSNAERFTVLHEEFFDITGNATVPTDDTQRTFSYFRKCNLVTQYNAGVAGSVADIVSGGLFFMVCGSNAAGTAAPSSSGFLRIRFLD